MPDMTVAENIFLGELPMTRSLGLPTVDDRAMKQRSPVIYSMNSVSAASMFLCR